MQQYAETTGNLTARIAIHAYGTNPQGWYSWLAERLPSVGDVLEVGAGTGELWRHLDPRRAGLRLTLADFSAAMCERLGEVAGAEVRRCDATDLPFADGSFDAVIANHMLYHVDEPDMALREFARVLRPGGRLFVATNGRGHMAELFAVAAAVGKVDVSGSASRSNFTAEDAPAAVGRHFRDVAAEAYPSDLLVPDAEPVLAYLTSLSGKPLTGEQLAAARELVQARIEAEGHFRVRKHTELITAAR
ncbi:Methyltransferase domain-containing protein [Paractinoplanes atraurantiacus]|uniref:Methyltransferase domain-containing protein n=1 Tax=Paractinoplanes atraurantiacus TaxID=1036182 RepID=A0A285IMF3_9ACTN|nr:Methyltransferase domain-containing protein [Actinoplanes atraurantiacus]